ncbi:hypothetical protein B4U80_09461 [Leptotrombidium deliense]|uniref:Uncharacterized protein n=1 Tax=Leptotrombidium deliense TaxID=299467 RepID=A0A443SU27_9ACAR|nr:hypothetical protein B4U80_09461 [Leptotrombidium deliense]
MIHQNSCIVNFLVNAFFIQKCARNDSTSTTLRRSTSKFEVDVDSKPQYGSFRRQAQRGGNINSSGAVAGRKKYSIPARMDPRRIDSDLRSPSDNGSDSDNDSIVSSESDLEAGVRRNSAIGYGRTQQRPVRSDSLKMIYGMSVPISGPGNTAANALIASNHGNGEPPPPYQQSTGSYQSRTANNNLGGATTSSVFQNMVSQNSTTGPMVPQPNNVHPSQVLESSDAPPQLRGTGFHSSAYQSHHQQSSASSAFAAFAASRFNFNFGKTCTPTRHRCFWQIVAIVLMFVCLLLLTMFIYKQVVFLL